MTERESPFSLARLRELVRFDPHPEVPNINVTAGELGALVEAASVAKWHILGEYAPGVSYPSAADFEALRVALEPFAMERRGE